MGVIWMELEAVVGEGTGESCGGSDLSTDLLKGLRARSDDKRRKKYAVVGDNVRNNVSVRREVVEDDGIMFIAKD